MIRYILKNGKIEPLDELPAHWRDAGVMSRGLNLRTIRRTSRNGTKRCGSICDPRRGLNAWQPPASRTGWPAIESCSDPSGFPKAHAVTIPAEAGYERCETGPMLGRHLRQSRCTGGAERHWAIQAGIDDMENGRYQLLTDFDAEFRKRNQVESDK